jgi:two-component system sensor histidine kinase UhpB
VVQEAAAAREGGGFVSTAVFVKGAALVLAYALLWAALWSVSRDLWFLPAGLRLGVLWATPVRRWPILAAAEWIATLGIGSFDAPTADPMRWVSIAIAPWLLYAGAVLLLRGSRAPRLPATPGAMALMLAAGMLAAAAFAPLINWVFPVPGAEARASIAQMFAFFYGDVIGQIAIAPLLVALVMLGRPAVLNGRMWALVLFVQVPSMLLLLWSGRDDPAAAPYAYLLAFAPQLLLAFTHGWVGAAAGVLVTGIATEVAFRSGLAISLPTLQLTLALLGLGTLLLGAASSALRSSHAELARRSAEYAGQNRQLEETANELREVSQRLVRLQEKGQRDAASELHDALGQSVTALATRVSLALREARDTRTQRMLESLREQVFEVHDSLRRALRQLRPAVLDAYGLEMTLADGPLREVLEDAGIAFMPSFEGEVNGLDEDATTAIYRICQEAVFNAAKYSRADAVRLEVAVRTLDTGRRLVRLVVSDDGQGMDPEAQVTGGQGLTGIRDRVLALGGDYVLESGPGGTRHEIVFETAG